jgi:hypothetical protein
MDAVTAGTQTMSVCINRKGKPLTQRLGNELVLQGVVSFRIRQEPHVLPKTILDVEHKRTVSGDKHIPVVDRL